jgi:ribosomal protein S18 acetylase RimI-like enzyme
VKIRPAENADAPAISNVYVTTWRDTYLGIVPFGYLYDMSPISLEQDFVKNIADGQQINYVAEDGGKIVGFICGGDERQGDVVYNGEIYALYVLKQHQRRGVGAGLVSAFVTELNAYGIHSMLVRVLADNPYRHFYEKINGVYLQKQRRRFAGEMLETAAYGWIDTDLAGNPSGRI